MSYQLPMDEDAGGQPVDVVKEAEEQGRQPVERTASQMKLIEEAAADTVPPVPSKQPVQHSDLGDDRKDLPQNQYEHNAFDIDASLGGDGARGSGPAQQYEQSINYQRAEAEFGRSVKAGKAVVG